MKQLFWNNIKRFKFKSVFVRYYIYILLLALVMNGIFSVYIYRTYIQNMKSSQNMALSAFLTQAGAESDNSVRLLYETILSISKDSSIAKTVVAPSMENSTRNSEIAMKLSSSAMNFDYINKIYLYESTDDMLFTSDEKIVRKNASLYRNFIDFCLSDRTPCFDSSLRQSAKLVSYRDHLYMICQFIPVSDTYIGLIAAEINTDKLFSGIRDTLSKTDYFMSVRMPDETLLLNTKKADPAHPGDMTYLSMTSDFTGWEYQIFFSSAADYSLGKYIRGTLPFLLGMFLISLLVSFFVATSVYSPIHQLMYLVEDNAEEDRFARNEGNKASSARKAHSSELELLSSKYTKLASDNKAAETFIREAGPDLESGLILDMIHGRAQITDDDVRSQLNILNSALDPDARYQCFKVKLSPLEQTEQLIYHMTYHQLKQKLTELFRQNQDQIYFLFFHDETFSFAVQYHPDKTDSSIHAIQRFLSTELRQEFGDISEEVLIASGKVRDGIEGLSASYYEAKDELKKLIYYGQDTPDPENRDSRFDDYLIRIQKVLEEERPEDIPFLAGQMLDELCVPETDPETLYKYCSGLIDLLLGKIYAFPSASTEDLGAYKALYNELSLHQNVHDLHQFMKSSIDRLAGRLVNDFNKRQNKIISGAKEYIQLNYADSNLSIHDIADAVGITDAYLSSIFTEYTGENLVTCLNRYRVDMAKELLMNTNIIIKDVGFKTGFYTIQNFNRVFKRFTGSTPGEFRKQNQNPSSDPA